MNRPKKPLALLGRALVGQLPVLLARVVRKHQTTLGTVPQRIPDWERGSMAKRKRQWLVVSGRMSAAALLWGTIALAQAPVNHFVLQSGRGLGGPIGFSPDGRWLASADAYGIQLIDLATLREAKFLSGTNGAPRTLLFSPDGRWLVSGNQSSEPGEMHRIQIWDVQEGRLAREFIRHRFPVVSLAFSPDGRTLLSAGENATVIEWDWQTGRPLRITSHMTGEYVAGVLLSPDGRLLAEFSGTPFKQGSWESSENKVYEATTKHVVAELTSTGGYESPSMAFSPDGGWYALNGFVWDLHKVMAAGPGATAVLEGSVLAVDSSGKILARVYDKETSSIQLHDLSGRTKVVLDSRRGWPAAAAFNSDSRKLAYVRRASTESLALWDLTEMRELGEIVGPPAVQIGEVPLEPIAFSPDGSELAVGTNGNDIWIWDAVKWVLKKRLHGDCSVRLLRFSPRGDRLAAFCDPVGHGVLIWDPAGGAITGEIKEAGFYFAFTPDGRQLAWLKGSGPEAVLHFSDVQTGDSVRSLHAPGGEFQFTPDGTRIVGELAEGHQYGWSTVLGIWNADNGVRRARIRDAGNIAVSPEGPVLATGSWLYDASTGEKLRRYTMRTGFVHALTFSPDGRWLAAGWTDGSGKTAIVLWDAHSWQEVAELFGHDTEVTQLVFGPDGRQLVSVSYDRTVRVWRLDDIGGPKQ